MNNMFAFIGGVGWQEILLLGLLALLIFGRRLPEVARNLGKGIVEFKKGLRGIEDAVDEADGKHKLEESSTNTASQSQKIHNNTTSSAVSDEQPVAEERHGEHA